MHGKSEKTITRGLSLIQRALEISVVIGALAFGLILFAASLITQRERWADLDRACS